MSDLGWHSLVHPILDAIQHDPRPAAIGIADADMKALRADLAGEVVERQTLVLDLVCLVLEMREAGLPRLESQLSELAQLAAAPLQQEHGVPPPSAPKPPPLGPLEVPTSQKKNRGGR